MKLTIGEICELYNNGVEVILHNGSCEFRKMTKNEFANKEFEYENIENDKIKLNVLR